MESNQTKSDQTAHSVKAEALSNSEKVPTVIKEHKFFALIVLVIFVAYLLVLSAMHLYNTSGAAQLDLSRPGYQSVREKARDNTSDKDLTFPSSGKLDKESLDSFRNMYESRAGRVTSVKGFQNDVLSDEALGMYGDNGNSSSE